VESDEGSVLNFSASFGSRKAVEKGKEVLYARANRPVRRSRRSGSRKREGSYSDRRRNDSQSRPADAYASRYVAL
jgi:hypothetical protein